MATLTVDQHREQMMRWLHTGRGYEFLTMATPYLHACKDDDQVRLLACQEYLKLGLVEPARELLDVSSTSPEVQAQVDAVRTSLASLKGKRIDWSQYGQCLEHNLDAMDRRGVDVSMIKESWQQKSSHFEIFRDNAAIEQVRRRNRNGAWQWVPRLGDHETIESARDMPDGIGDMMPGPYLFEGLDLGWFFQRIYHATLDTFHGYCCPLFVVEPDPASLAMVLHLHDWTEVIADERVQWFFGPSCVCDLKTALEKDVDLPLPSSCLRAGGFVETGQPTAISIVEEVGGNRHAAVGLSLRGLQGRYASRDAKFWAKRFSDALDGDGAPLRILAAVSCHSTFLQYSMRDAKRAFESLGHECTVLMEKSPHHLISTARYHQTIREWEPDLFFNIDHLRPEFPEIVPANLPVLTWDQDRLPNVFTKANIERIGPLDFVAGWSKPQCVTAGCDERQLLYARVPTCPEQFSGDPLTDEERQRFACDISYVSHASQTPRAFHEEQRAATGDSNMQRLLDTLYEILPRFLETHRVLGGGLPKILLEEASQRCGVGVESEEARARLFGWYLWRLGDRIFRHQALEWVAHWAKKTGRSLRIHGNGWEEHPTLASFAAGPVENGRELLCVYRASKINLQLMPAGFIHQRALDGLAAGGFFLSRQTPSDLKGRLLRSLLTRMEVLNIKCTRDLLDHDDRQLQDLLQQHSGEWLDVVDRDSNEFFHVLRCLGEEPFPDEVFPHFEEILFDSANEFAESAERFLQDRARRTAVAAEMRATVIERFSYAPTMKRFLDAMAAYFRKAAS